MHFHPGWDAHLRRPDDAPRPPRRAVAAALSAERLARIRQRVRDGFYASPNVMHQLAARLLDCGEL